MPLRYAQFSPAGELHRWVECYWRLTGEAGLAPHPQRILPDGYLEIILHLGDPFLRADEGTSAVRQARTLFAGQMIRPVRVMATGHTCVWGIRLHPWAAAAVAGVPASELTDRIEDAEAICPRLVKALVSGLADAYDASGGFGASGASAVSGASGGSDECELAGASDRDGDGERCVRALDSILARHLTRAAPIDPLVMAAGRLLLREPRPIADVARRMGVSPRHLTRTFRHAVGLTPKMFARISRFQRVAAVLDDDGPGGEVLAGVALACGYYDQSHLVRDVRAFAGGTPVALRAALDGELAEYFLRARRASHFSKIDSPALA